MAHETETRLRHSRDRCLRLQRAQESARYWQPLSGEDLIRLLGRGPGPWIGEVKKLLQSKVMDGTLDPNDRSGAAEIARDITRQAESQKD